MNGPKPIEPAGEGPRLCAIHNRRHRNGCASCAVERVEVHGRRISAVLPEGTAFALVLCDTVTGRLNVETNMTAETMRALFGEIASHEPEAEVVRPPSLVLLPGMKGFDHGP